MFSGDLSAVSEDGISYPAPMSYEERLAQTTRPQKKRRPRLYSARPFVPHDDSAAPDERPGREVALQRLMTLLDQRWAIFSGLRLPQQPEEVELLLVGPGGLITLEVPAPADWRLHDGVWFRATPDGQWVEELTAPGLAARSTADRLRAFLTARGFQRKNQVQPVVLLVTDHPFVSPLFGSEIWRLDELGARLASLSRAAHLSPFRANRIAALLEQTLLDQIVATTDPNPASAH